MPNAGTLFVDLPFFFLSFLPLIRPRGGDVDPVGLGAGGGQ